MNAFKVTYTDGTHYTTNANGTLAEFTAYLMQFSGVVTDENPVTGKETRRQIEKVEDVTEYSIYIEVKDPKQYRPVWKAVHPTGGDPYTWKTRQEAHKARGELYPNVYEGIKVDYSRQ